MSTVLHVCRRLGCGATFVEPPADGRCPDCDIKLRIMEFDFRDTELVSNMEEAGPRSWTDELRDMLEWAEQSGTSQEVYVELMALADRAAHAAALQAMYEVTGPGLAPPVFDPARQAEAIEAVAVAHRVKEAARRGAGLDFVQRPADPHEQPTTALPIQEGGTP